MLKRRRANDLPLVAEDAFALVGVADGALVERPLDALVRQFLAHDERGREVGVLMPPVFNRLRTDAEESAEFVVRRAEFANLARLLDKLRLVLFGRGHIAVLDQLTTQRYTSSVSSSTPDAQVMFTV